MENDLERNLIQFLETLEREAPVILQLMPRALNHWWKAYKSNSLGDQSDSE